MVKLKIRWTENAKNEFGKMLTYYDTRNGNDKYSRFIVKMVRESLRLAAKFPMMYRAVDAEEICDVRVFHWEYISVYYRIMETEILVETVFDTRQDPEKLPY